MFKSYTLFSLLSLFIVTTASAQYTDVINSNRPGASQSAFAVGKSVFQVESGLFGLYEKHQLLGTEASGFGGELDLRYGLFKEQLELNLEVDYRFDYYKTALGTETRNDVEKFIIGAKYLLYDPNRNYKQKLNIYSWKANNKFTWRQFLPAVAVYAGANINFSNTFTFKTDPSISPKLVLVTQNQFSGGFVVVTNIIADKVTTDFPSYGYVVTVTKGFDYRWSGFIENQGYISDYYSDAILRGGAAFLINEDLQVDASVSTNFKNTPTVLFGGVGLSWRFDKNYQSVLTRIGKAKSNKSKEKKLKKKKIKKIKK